MGKGKEKKSGYYYLKEGEQDRIRGSKRAEKADEQKTEKQTSKRSESLLSTGEKGQTHGKAGNKGGGRLERQKSESRPRVGRKRLPLA